MARRARASQPCPRLGKQPPRYRFFLNPYTDVRFTTCPQCRGKTSQRKLPLVIHIDPLQLVALNKTCRYCPRCDLLIAHQANRRILTDCAAALDVDMSKVYMNIDRYGNTSGASIPVAMCEAWEAGMLSPGDRLLLLAFGGGYTWGGAMIRWNLHSPASANGAIREVAVSPHKELDKELGKELGRELGQVRLLGVGLT